MFKKLFLLYLILVTAPLVGMLSSRETTRHIVDFNDFTNPRSEFREDFTAFDSFGHKIEHLIHQCKTQIQSATESQSKITITHIPTAYGTATATLLISCYSDRFNMDLYDENLHHCFHSIVRADDAHLARLDSYPQSFSGTCIMKIWESLCYCLNIEHATITDSSRCNDFELRKLLPFITGSTWYGTFGYIPVDAHEEAKAARHLKKFNQRPVSVLLKDFQDNSVVFDALQKALKLFNLTPDDSFSTLITQIYACYKNHTHPNQKTAENLLRIIYTNCLADYTAHADCSLRMKSYQDDIFYAWRTLKKNYSQ